MEDIILQRIRSVKDRTIEILSLAEKQVQDGKMTEQKYIEYCESQMKLIQFYDSDLYKKIITEQLVALESYKNEG